MQVGMRGVAEEAAEAFAGDGIGDEDQQRAVVAGTAGAEFVESLEAGAKGFEQGLGGRVGQGDLGGHGYSIEAGSG